MWNMKSLDQHFRQITRPAFEHYGFAHGDLVAQWAAIVGDDVAALCSPERLAWPRGRDKKQRQTEGATLTVRADQGAGLALSYQVIAIMERINAFFGYHAVANLKIVQRARSGRSPVAGRKVAKPTPDIIESVQQKTDAVQDSELKEALVRLGSAALANAEVRSKTPQ